MVQDAQGSKVPIQRIVDVVSGYFTPAVLILAIVGFVLWYDFGPEPALTYGLIVAVTTLIIACPCALGMAIPGHGVEATVEGRQVLLGNRKLMQDRKVPLDGLEPQAVALADDGKTPMYVAIDGRVAGLAAVADTLKDDSPAAIQTLRAMGLEVVMITGDTERTAKAIGRRVGIERVMAEVLPQEKAFHVQKLQLEGKRVAMVGDGINDAPALAQADVGLAIGTGTDVAIEASDITLIKGSLRGVVLAIQISRATMRNVYQNLFGAFIYNALGIPVALGALYPLLGMLLSPLMAAAAMSFSSVTVITNANRLKRFRPKGG